MFRCVLSVEALCVKKLYTIFNNVILLCSIFGICLSAMTNATVHEHGEYALFIFIYFYYFLS